MKKMLYAGVAACTITLFSCGKNETEAAKGPDKTNLTAVEALTLLKDDLSSGKIAGAWDAVPASYQTDVEGIIHDFANKVDPEIYNEAITTLGSLNKVLGSKKDILFDAIEKSAGSNASENEKANFKMVRDNWDTVTGLIGTALSTNIKDVESLKTLKLAEMTAKVQPDMIKFMSFLEKVDQDDNPVAQFKSSTFTLVSEDGDKATVKAKMPGQDEKEEVFVKVDNRWIPEDMSKEWKDKIEEAKKAVASMEKMGAAEKGQIVGMMKMVQGVIEEVDKAKSADEVEAILKKQMEQFGPMLMPLMQNL